MNSLFRFDGGIGSALTVARAKRLGILLSFLAGCVAAMPLMAGEVTIPSKTYCANDFGASAGSEVTNTAAIQKAIDAAAGDGGGVVTFKPGTYLSGAIFLKSNVRLDLAGNVELRAIHDDNLFPERPTRVAGIEMPWPTALVNVYQQTNVSITGKGSIDGDGSFWWKKFWGVDGKGGMLKDYKARGLRWAVDYDCKRVRALVVFDSQDVEIRDVSIKRSGFWSLALIYSGNVKIDGVDIRANIGGFGPSSDGIDIDSSHDILVQNCTIDCNDDDICLKAGRDADGLRVNRPTENIVIRNCVAHAGGGMITIGSETSGGIRNVEVSNMKALGTANGIRFKSSRCRGGVVDNIFIHDVVMEHVENPFNCELNWYPAYSYATIPPDAASNNIPAHWLALAKKVEPPERGIPEFRNIVVSNITATGASQAIFVNAYPEKPLHDVRFENIRIGAQKTGSISHAMNLTMNDVIITTPSGESLTLTDIKNVEQPRVMKDQAQLSKPKDQASATGPAKLGLNASAIPADAPEEFPAIKNP
jgi:polygalacturonase